MKTLCELQESGIPPSEGSKWVVAVAAIKEDEILVSYYPVGYMTNGGSCHGAKILPMHGDRGLRVVMENGDDNFVFLNTRGAAYIAYHMPTPDKTLRVDTKSREGRFNPYYGYWERVSESGDPVFEDFEIPTFCEVP